MHCDLGNKVTIKLFAGLYLSSEIRMNLNQSKIWKQASIASGDKAHSELIEVHHHGKDYLGCYLPSPKITLAQLNEINDQIKMSLKSYCPDLDPENAKVCIFAQVFVA